MGRILLAVVLLFFCFSCGQKRQDKPSSSSVVVEIIDSTLLKDDTLKVESADKEQLLVSEKMDDFFDDFIFSFAADEEIQKKRISFPLSYSKIDTTFEIKAEEWQHDSLFLTENYYTIILDKESDLDIQGDTMITSVYLDWIYPEEESVKRYFFEKTERCWRLKEISERKLSEDKNVSFIRFFYCFATDSIYQEEHIHRPLRFITSDPDDDFALLETTLGLNQWNMFKPELPQQKLMNISYGRENDSKSSTKLLQVKGIGNGFVNTFFFRFRKGKWKLYKFEDVNN